MGNCLHIDSDCMTGSMSAGAAFVPQSVHGGICNMGLLGLLGNASLQPLPNSIGKCGDQQHGNAQWVGVEIHEAFPQQP